MTVEIADPFGLAASRATGRRLRSRSPCCPASTTSLPLPRTVGPDPDGGAETGSLGRIGEDFAALRPYVVGDDLRRVHWPSSARTDDDLLVRQDDVPWQGRICVVLDLRRECHDADTLERAVSAAASILRAHLRRGDHVRLVTTTGVDSGYGVGASHLDGLLEYLAVADRSNRGSLHAALDLADRGAGGALVARHRPSQRPPTSTRSKRLGAGVTTRRIVRLDTDHRTPPSAAAPRCSAFRPAHRSPTCGPSASPPLGRTSRVRACPSSRSVRRRPERKPAGCVDDRHLQSRRRRRPRTPAAAPSRRARPRRRDACTVLGLRRVFVGTEWFAPLALQVVLAHGRRRAAPSTRGLAAPGGGRSPLVSGSW